MWKLAVAFVVFAALAVWILTRSGGNVDLRGEGHAPEAHPAASAAASAAAADPAASAASR